MVNPNASNQMNGSVWQGIELAVNTQDLGNCSRQDLESLRLASWYEKPPKEEEL